jgi:O-antigen ligase
MGSNGIALGRTHAGTDTATRVQEYAFAAFLLLVFIGLAPFAVRDPSVLVNGETIAAGEGDLIRQVLYLVIFATIVCASFQREGVRMIDAIPIGLAALLLWCGLSAFWAQEPGITIRRVGLEVVVVGSVMCSVNSLGAERAFRILRHVLALVLIINWLSIPIFPQAVHLPGETDPGIVGDWRGLYFHKNITGAVCALSAIIFLYYAIKEKSRADLALLVATLGFLFMTRSKSSMGLLPLGVGAGALYYWAWKRPLDRAIVVVGIVLAAVLIGSALLIYSDQINAILSDPQGFTGRTEIWSAEVSFIRDHLLLGSGFGSFADTGSLSPLHDYVGQAWVQSISHGHNGYLQLTVTTGLVGFALAMWSIIISPGIAFWRRDNIEPIFKAFLFSLFIFFVFHNLTESDFLESDGASWVVFLMIIAGLRVAPRIGPVS